MPLCGPPWCEGPSSAPSCSNVHRCSRLLIACPVPTMSLLRVPGLILLLPALAFAAKPLGHEVCVASCYNALKDIKFTNQPGGNGTSCLNYLKVSSTFACTRVRCQDP